MIALLAGRPFATLAILTAHLPATADVHRAACEIAVALALDDVAGRELLRRAAPTDNIFVLDGALLFLRKRFDADAEDVQVLQRTGQGLHERAFRQGLFQFFLGGLDFFEAEHGELEAQFNFIFNVGTVFQQPGFVNLGQICAGVDEAAKVVSRLNAVILRDGGRLLHALHEAEAGKDCHDAVDAVRLVLPKQGETNVARKDA